MEVNVLTDRLVKPDDELVFSIIGEKSILWRMIFSYLHLNYPDIAGEWKFYNDGKCWLFRAIKKKKTIFWISVLNNTFRVTFWLGDKAIPLIEQSDLTEKIKNDFNNAKRYKIGRGIWIIMTENSDVDNVIKLMGIKLKLK
jgi:hypothetical protein